MFQPDRSSPLPGCVGFLALLLGLALIYFLREAAPLAFLALLALYGLGLYLSRKARRSGYGG